MKLSLLATSTLLVAACLGTTATPSSSDGISSGGPSGPTADGGEAGRTDAAFTDASADGPGGPTLGGQCGDSTCAADEVCVPGCRGICVCDEAPETGTCPLGPCSCGKGCEPPPPPSRCEKTVPSNCTVEPDGSLLCICG